MEKSLATNDGELEITEVVALSGPVIVSKQRFLSGIVIKRRNGIAQAVHMGDLIAIENTKRQTKKNYYPGRWTIAQVLGFQGTETIMVMHLRHVKEVSKQISNAKFVTEYVRVDNSLAVSRSVQVGIAVRRILPISIHLLSEKVYQHGNYLNYICEEMIEEWNYQCHFELPETLNGSLPAVEKDPSCLLPSKTDGPSDSVVEAITQLQIPDVDTQKLAKRLVANYKRTEGSRFQCLKSSQSAIENVPPVATGKRKAENTRKRDEPDGTVPVRSTKHAKKQHTAPTKKQHTAPTKKRPAPTIQEEDAMRPKSKASFHVELGPVCYQTRSKDSHLSFYNTITLEKKWIVQVGSLVKVNCANRQEAPAQVLSIYRSKDAGHVFLEVRWFYRVSELPPQLDLPNDLKRDEIIEVDEDVSHVKPANLVGPTQLISYPKKRTKTMLLCRYKFSIKQFSFSLSDNLVPVTHWSGQKTSRIGLDCPKAFPGKIPALLHAYGGSEAGVVVVARSSRKQWSKEEFSRKGTVTPGSVLATTSDRMEYFEYIEWRPIAERYSSKTTAKRLCKASIGDTVCIMSEDSAVCEPFSGSWRLAQILAIYQRKGESSTRLEVRWCLRFSDLPKNVQEWAPETDENQFFESDVVERHVLASHVLAPAILTFTRIKQRRSFEESGLRVQCPYFFASESLRIQSLISHEVDSVQKGWFVQRGLQKSALVCEVDSLNHRLQSCMLLPRDDKTSSTPPLLAEPCAFDIEQRILLHEGEKSSQRMIISCSIQPQWHKCIDTSCLLPGNEQTRWKCRIGDIVAVEAESDSDHCGHLSPFSVRWEPAQVVAFREKASQSSHSLEAWLRPFHFHGDSKQCVEVKGSLRTVVPTENDGAKWRNASTLLGPLLLIPLPKDRQMIQRLDVWGWWYPFIPTNAAYYGGRLSPEVDSLDKAFANGIQHMGVCLTSKDMLRVIRALAESDGFTTEGVQLPLLCAIDQITGNESNAAEPNVLQEGKSRVQTIGSPLYNDAKASYYGEISVKVSQEVYTPILNDVCKDSDEEGLWRAKVGDPVVLFYDSPKSKSVPYIYRSSREVLDHKFGPFLVPTAVGEIVTIRKEGDDRILLEMRWFYRESELNVSGGCGHTCEEVLETDLFTDNVAAENLIAPARLHNLTREVTSDINVDGLPVIELVCNRFWSAIRKCPVPVSGLEGRIARGRMKSKRVGSNASLMNALNDLFPTNVVEKDNPPAVVQDQARRWRTPFEKTISKLSLTDAAKETDGNLSAIVGREIERRKISAFVHGAVCGFRDTGKRPSLFVAGPPGTGKTATIRAVIRDFQGKQAASRGRQMRFIILNGMETRHPHDIYSMLWDELESNENGRVNPKKAASNLKKYFTTKTKASQQSPELIVVMLDEIDYIVTKSQEVLYDMFDLPLLSLEKKTGRQLVMIGVSNMLNLPDKLHPRVQSRIGGARVFFKSYSVEETKAILLSKLKAASPTYDVFHDDAILYASKKTAAMSGDIRKAFHMCKQAAELVLDDSIKKGAIVSSPKVFIKDVLRVSRDSFNSSQSRMIALSSPLEALLIVTLASLSKTTGRELGGFDVEELVTKMASVANAAGDKQYLPPPGLDETLIMLRNLGESNLINLDSPQNASLSYRAALAGSGGAWPLVSLSVDDVAVLVALKNTQHQRLAQKHLGRQ